MQVNCEGCAGCCTDWRPLSSEDVDHERQGRRLPLDDAYNVVPLTRDEVRDFLDAGYGDAMTPRLWEAKAGDDTVTIDGHAVVAIDGHPVFFVGLRKPPKPVGPFGIDDRWLDTCIFLDPETLRCRIHDSPLYPRTCRDYPGQNLVLGSETECERVEAAYGGERLVDNTPPEDTGLALGPHALGSKLFVYPDTEELTGVVQRVADGTLADADRARFVGIAVGSSAGTTTIHHERAEEARQTALAADSWAGNAIDEWETRAGDVGTLVGDDVTTGSSVEDARGASETKGW